MARVRITGGQWRSRLIQVKDAEGLRPTPDRVRETLFNWLGHDLAGLSCLDLFAGSGILGFEAASRGADRVTMVERDKGVFRQLRTNAELLLGSAVELVCDDALQFVSPVAAGYDLLFLDPPYRQGWLERLEPRLAALVNRGGRIYAEAEHPIEGLGEWRVVKRGQAGQVHFHLLEHP
ncbi:16S rRNA (guanine(966)-N(2))-methyltransferase RsmD [Denitratisoma sp. DHT3]|uniref:16S rRNA (guanine(966)-N(2))-methyltransferase RsmD n=1 Tax=Denitratisoma sp. DHT3 TaxID=1981880 RepID=UPI001198AF99|nr:16S rRNA (guanine(966)-N(2))-methyltransferase RsmD [Denitratisoma sp. DHT3]QDX82029.1 16S rRNA (guanine(966)-N(2))-methyltransferase RsmD [Denitratisoma sp. DHT3]